MTSPVVTIEVTVGSHSPALFSHVSPSAAFASAWRAYQSAYECSFRDFMRVARRRKVPNPPGVGDAVRVCGRNAWMIDPHDHCPQFVYDGERTIMRAHHSEVETGHRKEQSDG